MQRFLMHKNEKVALLTGTIFYTEDFEVYNSFLMPFLLTSDIKKNNELFLKWQSSRFKPNIPQNFTNPKLSVIGETLEDIHNFLQASICDCFWFCPYDLDILWEDINYFDNKPVIFDEKIELKDDLYKFSNNSIFLNDFYKTGKLNKRINDIVYSNSTFYFRNAENILDNGLSVFANLIGNILADSIDLETAQYYISPLTLKINDTEVVIPVAIFESPISDYNYELISIHDILNKNNIEKEDVFSVLESYNFKTQLNKIIVLNYLICDSNRNFENTYLIRDTNTLLFNNLAPVFNYGNAISFFSNVKENSNFLMDTHLRELKLVDNFDFVDFNALFDALNLIEIILSYSPLSVEEQNLIILTLSQRIKNLENIINKCDSKSATQKLKAAIKINRRFVVEDIIKYANIDPIIEQTSQALFFNFLSESGKREFDAFQPSIGNIKQRFENFKKDTLLS